MKKRIILTTAAFAAIHLVLSIGSVMISFGSSMERFDHPEVQPSMLERIADPLATILVQPAMSLWTPWMSRNMPGFVEWGLYLANSLLWGFVAALILRAMSRKRSGKERLEPAS